jgi:hypothetical protein
MQINTYTVRSLLALFNEKTVYVDRDIQRRPGNWSKDMLRDCLRSYNLGRVPAPIVLADSNACLKWLKIDALRGMDSYSREYYEARIASGYDYIVLDGQHKLFDVLHGFVNNKWSYSGYLIDANGVKNPEPGYENVFFKDLPQRTKDAIMDAQVSLAMFGDLSAIDLSEVFLNLQKGVPLNDQQKRRANRTKLTGWIRDLAEGQPLIWSHLLGKTGAFSLAGSGDEELLIKLLVSTVREWDGTLSHKNPNNFDHNRQSLDLVYEEGVGIAPIFGSESPYNQKEFERFEKIFNLFGYVVSQLKDDKGKTIQLKSRQVWTLFWAIEYVWDNSLQIQSSTTLFEQVDKALNRLLSQSHREYSAALTEAEDHNAKPEEDKMKLPSEHNYFHKRITVPHQAHRRKEAKKEFLKEFTSEKVLKLSSLTVGYAAAK